MPDSPRSGSPPAGAPRAGRRQTGEPHRADRRAGADARALLHTAATASLATATAGEGEGAGSEARGAPYASLVAPAPDMAGTPLLFLSDLAQHTRNLAADPRAGLLLDGTHAYAEPLAGPRVGLQGVVRPDDREETRARYLRWQPQAARYAGLSDFRIYRLELTHAHLVSGFGKARWIAPEALVRNIADARALMDGEAEIVAHMNAEHADALAEIAGALTAGAPMGDTPAAGASASGEISAGTPWRLAGVDPEGADLARGAVRLRLAFTHRVRDPDGCRRELARATQRSRKRDGN